MKCEVFTIRSGYDKEKCLVHTRCCHTPDIMVATAQYLNVAGSDLFSGIYMATSTDNGKTWSEFKEQTRLEPIKDGEIITVGCDATPLYHEKTGKILLLGHTAQYKEGGLYPIRNHKRYTFYSVYDKEKNEFTKMKLLKMPEGFENCGNGCGQSVVLENGDILIPVYYMKENEPNAYSVVLKCSFDGENLELLQMGNSLTVHIERGLLEPSLIYHKGTYYLTLRNDECGLVAKSEDGLNFTDMQLWKWDDGSVLQNYNTQQHWMVVGDDLCLVYTRRAEINNRVFRHRAPLFAAKVENMRLVRDSEIVLTPERGARLGNFGSAQFTDGKAIVMVGEWMQPRGCERYGSDNSIFMTVVEE